MRWKDLRRLAIIVGTGWSCTVAVPVDGMLFRRAGVLVEAAQEAKADQLLLLRRGKVITSWTSMHYEPPHQLMSVTKSVVALAIGRLIDEKKLRLDDRLDRYFPAWNNDPRGKITVEQVLEQSTGLSTSFPYADLDDCIAEALRQSLKFMPGSHWEYNNDAVNLLSGIVEHITGSSLEKFVQEVLFLPLGIESWTWYKDTVGHTWVMTGLAIGPADLGKIGQLVLNLGAWNDKQLLSKIWVTRLSQRSKLFSGYGALWWVGFDFISDIPEELRIAGRNFVWAQGDANQLLVLAPASQLVLVLQTERLRRPDAELDFPSLDAILSAFIRLASR